MRRALLTGVLSAITILSGLAASGSAQAVPARVPNLDTAPRFLSATAGGFRVEIRVGENRESRAHAANRTTCSGGNDRHTYCRQLVLRFVNHASHDRLFARVVHAPAHSSQAQARTTSRPGISTAIGRVDTGPGLQGTATAIPVTSEAIVRNVSASRKEIDYPDGRGVRAETDRSWNAFGPLSQTNITGTGPHRLVAIGRVKAAFATARTRIRYVTSISRSGSRPTGARCWGLSETAARRSSSEIGARPGSSM